MGNEFSEENEIKQEPNVDFEDDYVKYGIISKKGGEKEIDDTFVSFSDLESSKKSKKQIHFGLFGVFDGHNNVYVAKYLSDKCKNFFEEEVGDIDKNNCEQKIQEIFKAIDKELKTYGKKDDDKNINVGVNEKEIKYFKDLIQNAEGIPNDLKNIEDSQIKDLLLFRDLFKYNNNYLYSSTDVDYIGSSASIVLINNDNIITADLGITACILVDKQGKIINVRNNKENKTSKENKDNKENKDKKDIEGNKDLLKPIHVFTNKSEKKRIKKFNEIDDYENLKYNIYVPASRCFGLFKYKADEILKEENQIISCIPEVNIYNRDSVDFILLMTKGMINLFKDNINELIEKIVKQFNEKKEKISEILNSIIEEKIKESEEKEKNQENKNGDKSTNNNPLYKNSSIYVGKEDFGEENEIINELKKNYYKDIMDLNKNNCYSCHDKFNITCILMKISDKKYPIIEVKKVVEENKIEIEKKDENVKDNNDKKEEGKQEEKKDENEIKEININKELEKVEEKINEPDKEIKIEKREEDKENKDENNKIEIKAEAKQEEKIEEIKKEGEDNNVENKEINIEKKIEIEKINEDENKEENKKEDDKGNIVGNNNQEEKNVNENKVINIDEENKNKEEKKEGENE